MITQSTRGPIKRLNAFIIALLCVLSLIELNRLLLFVTRRGLISYTLGTVILWAFAIALFVIVLTRFCLASLYELDGVKIVFSRIYVKRPRLEESVLLRELVYFGPPEGAGYTVVRTRRFSSSRSGFSTQALIYKRGGKLYRILFDPNPEISQKLMESFKK